VISRSALPLLLCAPLALAQSFEVASVKPTTSNEIEGVYRFPGGRVWFRGCSLAYLIQVAFDAQEFQIAAAPTSSVRYDVEATAPEGAESRKSNPLSPKAPLLPDQRQMLRSLLVERFHLKFHRESREAPVFLLTLSGKPLKLSDTKKKSDFPWSGGLSGGGVVGDGLAGESETMADLAQRLSSYMGRPVLDRTGLTGFYDFRVPYQSVDARPDIPAMISSCLRDLGLKLEASKAPVEKIVIDAIDATPIAN
jgi:uncharacterized protein (TIGR03435 family)